MRKLALIAGGSLAAIIIVAAIAAGRRKAPAREATPEVLNVGPSEVTVAWTSGEAYVGRVFYSPLGSGEPAQSATEAFGQSGLHEVVIRGLRPSTRYGYRLEGSEARYQFQTQPLPATPFSFLVVWGDVSGRVTPLMMSEMPEFVLSLTPAPEGGGDPFSEARPYVPVYGPSGVDSPFMRATGEERAMGPWKLDWGGLRLVFHDGRSDLSALLDAPGAHTVGVVAASEPEEVRASSLHSALAERGSGPAAFVIAPGEKSWELEADGVRYLGLDVRREAGAMRVDVGVESVTAFLLDEGREIVLRSPPLREKRTCEECRRLADRGAYEQSVRAYEDFIATHAGHFQIDDAYFAIAGILDEKLFRFPDALRWYRRLLDEYAESALAPLAKQRIAFLAAHADHEFKPLARFERVRRVEFARKKHSPEEREKCLEEVRTVLSEFPDCSLAPAMHYWLANQYRRDDPDRAVSAYLTLAEKFPGHEYARVARLEIGAAYYDARRFREAVGAYGKALAELPERSEEIEAQIARACRNIRRGRLAVLSWLVLVLVCALGALWPPRGVAGQKLLRSAAAFALLAAVLSFAGWLIHEQFASAGELVALVFGFAASATFGLPFSAGFAEKVLKAERGGRRQAFAAFVGAALGMLFFAAGMYLTAFYVNEHYLVVAGL